MTAVVGITCTYKTNQPNRMVFVFNLCFNFDDLTETTETLVVPAFGMVHSWMDQKRVHTHV